MTMMLLNEDSSIGDIVREFTMLYDKGDPNIRKLVDAWYVARDFGEVDMIECQMEAYKKECYFNSEKINEN